MVTLRLEKDLGLVHQPAECLAVNDPVNIPLIAGTHILFPGFFLPGTTGRPVRKGGLGIQAAVFQPFQFFPCCHGNHSLSTKIMYLQEMPGIPDRFPYLPPCRW